MLGELVAHNLDLLGFSKWSVQDGRVIVREHSRLPAQRASLRAGRERAQRWFNQSSSESSLCQEGLRGSLASEPSGAQSFMASVFILIVISA